MASNRTPEYGPYPAPGYVTTQQYADHAGLSRVAIQNKIADGKLEGCWYKDNLGRYHLDKAKCDEAIKYKSTNEINNQKTRKYGAKEKLEANEDPVGDRAAQAYNSARSANEVIKLQKAQIELKELQGSLVSADQVKKEQFLLARLLRDQLMSFPDRISALLTSMTDERKINTLLKNEIRSALKVVSDQAAEELEKNA